ncbi:MAG: membrane protein insertion efficiency factor YidD [Verrucomicrobiota bacterium]
MFSVVGALAQASPDLAVDLFAEGDWAACRRECRRVLAEDTEQQTARLLDAVARLRLGEDRPEILDSLARLAAVTGRVETSSMAAYELGRQLWRKGNTAAAFGHIKQAFETTRSPDLFLRAGCSLSLLTVDFPTLGKDHPSLRQSLETCRPLWTSDIRKECTIEPAREREHLLSKPGQWIVRFYRAQLRPAIGARCSLEPSCSEYFREASREHGLLAFPITADRLVREPSVVAAKEKEVQVGEQMRIADPLADHDDWMKR